MRSFITNKDGIKCYIYVLSHRHDTMLLNVASVILIIICSL